MPTFLIATDSFKDALPALEVCRAIARGIQLASPAARVVLFPLGDGGEGTAEVLAHHTGGSMVSVEVKDPLFRSVQAVYGLSADGRTAFIEMAAASGLERLKPSERDALQTTSYGTGELILDAIQRGARHLILCIGGSATHDCGAGMAEALGYTFLDAGGQPVSPVGGNLARIAQIDPAGLRFHPAEVTVEVLCDVSNPLCGPHGAAYTFARQKGAGDRAVMQLEAGTRHFAILLQEQFGKDVMNLPGAGAAGGMGAGAVSFLNARLVPGIEAVLELTRFREALAQSDYLITGEGRLDGQTLHGKLISGITTLAKEYRIPVFALCGSLQLGPGDVEALGLVAACSIQSQPATLAEAIADTARNLEYAAFSVARVLSVPPLSSAPMPETRTTLDSQPKRESSPLTRREREVLRLLAHGKSNREIAHELFISHQTVAVHRKNIMRKFAASNIVALLKSAQEAGILN